MAPEIVKTEETENNLSNKQKSVISAACFVFGLLIFFVASFGMRGSGLGALNQPVLNWMISHRFNTLTDFEKVITTIASPVVLIVVTGSIIVAWAIIKRELWRPFLLVCAMATSALTSTFLKTIFMDARPQQINMIPMFEIDYSFPSGHTLGILVFLLTLGYLIYSRHFSKKRLLGWLAAAMLGTSLIATSRLYLGYHWLTDVIASVGLGFVIIAIVIAVDALIYKRTIA